MFPHLQANEVGNYNALLANEDKSLYDSTGLTWMDSHDMFHKAFPAFAWEVIEVLAFPDLGNPEWPNVDNPDNVAFTWRHWGHFTGECAGQKGKGELIEMYGFATSKVSRTGPINLSDGKPAPQLCETELFFDADTFLRQLTGKVKDHSKTNRNLMGNGGCPFLKNKEREANAM